MPCNNPFSYIQMTNNAAQPNMSGGMVMPVNNMPNNAMPGTPLPMTQFPYTQNYQQGMPMQQQMPMPQQMPTQQQMPMQQQMQQDTTAAYEQPAAAPSFPIQPIAAPVFYEDLPETPAMSTEYTQGYLETQIGSRVMITFLIGSNIIVDRSGILTEVGISYVVLKEVDTGNLVLCDIFAIKFVRFYY